MYNLCFEIINELEWLKIQEKALKKIRSYIKTDDWIKNGIKHYKKVRALTEESEK